MIALTYMYDCTAPHAEICFSLYGYFILTVALHVKTSARKVIGDHTGDTIILLIIRAYFKILPHLGNIVMIGNSSFHVL